MPCKAVFVLRLLGAIIIRARKIIDRHAAQCNGPSWVLRLKISTRTLQTELRALSIVSLMLPGYNSNIFNSYSTFTRFFDYAMNTAVKKAGVANDELQFTYFVP